MLFYADFQALYSLDGKPYPGQAKKTSYYHQDCPGRPEDGVRDVDRNLMDHSPIRQTFEFGKSISTAGKSILHLIKL